MVVAVKVNMGGKEGRKAGRSQGVRKGSGGWRQRKAVKGRIGGKIEVPDKDKGEGARGQKWGKGGGEEVVAVMGACAGPVSIDQGEGMATPR